jgi:hypothetical protein
VLKKRSKKEQQLTLKLEAPAQSKKKALKLKKEDTKE